MMKAKGMGFSNEDGVILKTKSMASSLSTIISVASFRFASTDPAMQVPKRCSASAAIEPIPPPGLKALIYAPQTYPNPLILHSYTITHLRSPSRPPLSPDFESVFRTLSTHSSFYSSWSSGMDDILGTESGVYMSPIELIMPETEGCHRDIKRKRRQRRECQYPPPIPLLARTGNLHGHMPWILTRHYSNGRLVLKEKKVKHHEYFEAVRENGRLILHLVPLDDTFSCCHTVCEPNEDDEEVELENVGFCQGDDYLEKEIEDPDGYDYEDDDDEEEGYRGQIINISSASHSVPKFCHGNERYGDPRKCLTYSGRIISESTSMCSNGAGDEQQEGNATSSLAFCNVVPSDLACLVN